MVTYAQAQSYNNDLRCRWWCWWWFLWCQYVCCKYCCCCCWNTRWYAAIPTFFSRQRPKEHLPYVSNNTQQLQPCTNVTTHRVTSLSQWLQIYYMHIESHYHRSHVKILTIKHIQSICFSSSTRPNSAQTLQRLILDSFFQNKFLPPPHTIKYETDQSGASYGRDERQVFVWRLRKHSQLTKECTVVILAVAGDQVRN